MATKKKKTTKATGKSMAKRQITAIVLLTIAILMLFLLFIEGQNVWLFMHNLLLGAFGVLAYITPVFVGYIAIMLAIEKSDKGTKLTAIEVSLAILFLCTTVDIFSHSIEDVNYWEYLVLGYQDGTSIFGGGFFGAILGYPMTYLFSPAGARIISILLVFVFIMLITGTTLGALYSTASKPVKDIRELQRQRAEEREREAQLEIDDNQEATHRNQIDTLPHLNKKSLFKSRIKKSKGAKFNIDVPVADSDFHSNDSSSDGSALHNDIVPINAEAKRNKLINEYNGTADTLPTDAPQKDANTPEIKEETKPEKPKRKRKSGNVDSVDDLPAAGLTVEVDTDYKFPPIDLLSYAKNQDESKMDDERRNKSELLVNTLKSFGVETRLVGISHGPSVTRYELQPAAGVKISKITGLANDIALNLAAVGVRIEAPIPGKAAVGIEVPNKLRGSVGIRELLETAQYKNAKSKLCCVLGKDITGELVTMDLAKMPHLLVAGTTGSGKSVCLNSMIVSILYKARPDEVKLIMIDPKSVEFMGYNGIPHLLVPVVTNPQKAAGALGWAVNEMLKRYQIFSANSVRNISGYNELCKVDESLEPMPQIVIFIDELSDLMMAAPNEVEDSICRLAQMARAAGMHMVIATQSPRVDVITGLIKANVPSRISLTVSNATDSRIIIDMAGAEKLIGYGDMLYFPTGMNKPLRVQGCYVADEEINSITEFLKSQSEDTEYDEEIITEMEKQAAADKKNKDDSSGGEMDDCDERFNEAVEVICREGQASTSMLQRKLKLGYARAARIMDEMQEKGIIGPSEGAKPRKILITYNQWLERINGTVDVQQTLDDIDDDNSDVVSQNANFDDYSDYNSGVEEEFDYDEDDEPPFDED